MVIGLPGARATITSGRLRPFCANFLTGDGRSILPHLHMPPLATISGGNLPSVETGREQPFFISGGGSPTTRTGRADAGTLETNWPLAALSWDTDYFCRALAARRLL